MKAEIREALETSPHAASAMREQLSRIIGAMQADGSNGSWALQAILEVIADVGRAQLATETARADKAETSMSELVNAIGVLNGNAPGWPEHGNGALAVAASYALLRNRCGDLERRVIAVTEAVKQARRALDDVIIGSYLSVRPALAEIDALLKDEAQ